MKQNHEHLYSKAGIAAVIGGVALIDYFAPSNETISEGTDRLIEKHPVLTRAVIAYTALHLCNLLPEKFDLFHQLTKLKKPL